MIINSIHKYKHASRTWTQRNVNTIKKIVVHHTASRQLGGTDDEQLRAEANQHINVNLWAGLSYTFVILPNGNTHQINNFTDVTWTDGINFDCVAICLKGYFHTPYNEVPTAAQLKALKELLDELSTQHPEFPAGQGDVMGHRERSSTNCPGDKLFPYAKEYRDKLGNVNWSPTPTPPTPTPPAPITEDTLIPQIENKSVRDIKKELLEGRETIKTQTSRIQKMKEFVANA